LPATVAPPADAPTLAELFVFMAEAELRFETLRMRIVDRTWTARGEETEVSEVWLRHPSNAKVLTRTGSESPRAPSHIWLSDGHSIRTYETERDLLRERPVRDRPEGVTRDDLPSWRVSTHRARCCPWRRWPTRSSTRTASPATCWPPVA
jgi:hypothetical protein